jgi:hypothetical protein
MLRGKFEVPVKYLQANYFHRDGRYWFLLLGRLWLLDILMVEECS